SLNGAHPIIAFLSSTIYTKLDELALVHLADGGNYQTLINEALRQYIQQSSEPLEETLRRVVREELQRIEK
ncbi:hypothetical protein QUB52_29455, partial [Microcoleus sp. A6-C6]